MHMSNNVDFAALDLDQLLSVIGGFDWKSFGGSVASWGVGGAVAGGIGGAATGPGAVIGAAAGGAGGAIAGGVYNAGQQFGLWR
jgi:hypothetical protein